jgi:hypothetical protein
MNISVPKLRFDKSGYYFIGLLALVLLGFWKTYFSRFFSGPNNYNFYFHFHAAMMLLWVAMLITQPLLIRKKKMRQHRLVGKASYILMPVLLLSVLLVLNSGLKTIPEAELNFSTILFPFRDFFLLAIAFIIAIVYRHNLQIHARAMIITGIVFLEPALFRFLGRLVFQGAPLWAFYTGVSLMVSVLVTLIIMERNQKSARWLFPALLVVDAIVYSMMMFGVDLSGMNPLVKWLASLPLT